MNNQNCVIGTVLLFLSLGLSQVFGQPNFTFSPAYGKAGDQITITGSGFTANSTVRFGSKQASAQATSSSQIVATVPSGLTLFANVLVSVNGVNSQTYFTPIDTRPFISYFTPTNGDSATAVTIYGANFTASPKVYFNGTPASYVSSTIYGQLTAYSPANVVTGPITVTATNGTYTTSTNNYFYGHPVITGVTPSSGAAGTSVKIVGMNLWGASSVMFNGLPATFIVNSNTCITAVVPVGVTHGKITVTTPDMPVMSTNDFSVLPTVTDFWPKTGVVGTAVTITGVNLDYGYISVYFNGGVAALTSITSSQLVAVVQYTASSGPVKVSTSDGSVTTTNKFYLPPSVNNFNPIKGLPGTVVQMTGYNFIDTTNVSFNGISATFTVSDNGNLTTIVPVGASSGPFSVSGPGGTFINPSIFLVPPTLIDFSPDAGIVGSQVQITGSSFDGMTNVQFNGAAAGFTTNGNTLTATVPTNATTGKITLQSKAGSAVSSANFRVDPVKLTIVPMTNASVSISWPTSAVGYVLQSLGDLTRMDWAFDTNTPLISNIYNTVTNSETTSARFYRLKK